MEERELTPLPFPRLPPPLASSEPAVPLFLPRALAPPPAVPTEVAGRKGARGTRGRDHGIVPKGVGTGRPAPTSARGMLTSCRGRRPGEREGRGGGRGMRPEAGAGAGTPTAGGRFQALQALLPVAPPLARYQEPQHSPQLKPPACLPGCLEPPRPKTGWLRCCDWTLGTPLRPRQSAQVTMETHC